MERKTAGHKQQSWKGARSQKGFYKIDYDPPMSVLEILEFGPSSIMARIILFAFLTGCLSVLFSFFPHQILELVRGLDFLFLILGILILAVAFVLGKKCGRPFAIMLKWVGMPLLFLGIFGIVFARFGFGAFWVGPVDLYLGKTAHQIVTDGIGNGAFRGLLEMEIGIKESLLHEGAEGSVLTMLVRLYRTLGATMSYYTVIPILVLISLGIFIGTILLLYLTGWLTILIPVVVCALVSRGLCYLDEQY